MEIYLTFEELVVDEYVDAHPPVGALLDERDSLIDGFGEFGVAFRALPKETQSAMLTSELFVKWAVKYAAYTSKPFGEEN
jgi:hypothetical protein